MYSAKHIMKEMRKETYQYIVSKIKEAKCKKCFGAAQSKGTGSKP